MEFEISMEFKNSIIHTKAVHHNSGHTLIRDGQPWAIMVNHNSGRPMCHDPNAGHLGRTVRLGHWDAGRRNTLGVWRAALPYRSTTDSDRF